MIRRSTKSISFLMEFIIVIFFFALSSAVCVSVYASAKQINTKANDTKTAIILAQNYIATMHEQTESIIIYDEHGKVSKHEYFRLSVEETTQSDVANVNVYANDELLISLSFADIGGFYEE